MRYVLYRPLALPDAPLRIGALHPNGESVADVSAVLHDMGGSAPISSMRVFLGLGEAACRAAAERALAEPHYHRPLAHVNLRAPIYDPCVPFNESHPRAAPPAVSFSWRASTAPPPPPLSPRRAARS
jgi:hypothetical protein